jgi:predicted Zn-dependent protease
MDSKVQIASADITVVNCLRKIVAALGSYQWHAHHLLRFKLLNAQFLRQQKNAANDYSFDLMEKRGIYPRSLVTHFKKLAKVVPDHQKQPVR